MKTILLTIALSMIFIGCDNKTPNTNSALSAKRTENFLIGLCTVNTEEWAKYNCNSNLAMQSDEMSLLFTTFEDTSIVMELIFGSRCEKLLGASKCINKKLKGGSTYELLSDGSIIQNTEARGCISPQKYTMENGILYKQYGGDPRGSCSDEQIQSAKLREMLGKERIYYVKK